MSVIKTYDATGEQNGSLIPIWHVDSGVAIDQVYLTTILPWRVKGPHLHLKRRGLFCCIRGEVIVVVRGSDGSYATHKMKPGDPPFLVPPGVPAALYNALYVEALVLNMPSPPWREDDKDEHEVKDWNWRP